MGMPIMPQGTPRERMYPYWYAAVVSISPHSKADHTDRDLVLVPKKGRPVTQCQHCRSERKKRSAHVSCECGEGSDKPHHSKEKCIHLREAEERIKVGVHEDCTDSKHAAHVAAVADEQGCCCPHGGKCTCTLQKRHFDGDGEVTPPHGPAVKPRLETTKSDNSLGAIHHRHHKPVHRKNHLAHECGMPYKMPMPRAKTDHGVSSRAGRSVDSLALDSNMTADSSIFAPQTLVPLDTGRRMSKSEQHSPRVTTVDHYCSVHGLPEFNSIDFSSLGPVQTNQSMLSMPNDVYNITPIEPLSAIGDGSFDPWSTVPSADSATLPDNNPFGVWPTNPDVYGLAQPALTAASSGTQSEVDEIPFVEETSTFGMPSIQEDTNTTFGLGDFTSNQPFGEQNRRSLPANLLKDMTSAAEWPFQFNDAATIQARVDAAQVTAFNYNDDVWEGSNLSSITDMPKRHTHHGLSHVNRPSSRSVGPAAAPSNDAMRALFPEMNFDGSYFDSSGLNQDFGMSGTDADAANTLSQMDFGSTNEGTDFSTEDVDFTSQQWADGSMSIANDNYDSSYDLNQEYSDPGFDLNWSQ